MTSVVSHRHPQFMQYPAVSILLPTYNSSEYIRKTLTSLTTQDYPNLTIEIADDGSNDDTCDICAEWATTDARIEFRRNDRNYGSYGNFFEMVKGCNSPYVIWASHDDLWEPDFVSTLAAQLEGHPDAVAVQCATRIVRPDGTLVQVFKLNEATQPESISVARFGRNLLTGRVKGGAAKLKTNLYIHGLLHREVLAETIRAFSGIFSNERHLLLMMLLAGQFLYVDKVLFHKLEIPRRGRYHSNKGELPKDPYERLRYHSRFLLLRDAYAIVRGIFRSNCISWKNKLLGPILVFHYVQFILFRRFLKFIWKIGSHLYLPQAIKAPITLAIKRNVKPELLASLATRENGVDNDSNKPSGHS